MSAHLNFAIETARLRLRAWRADDFPAFAQLNADAQVMRYFPIHSRKQKAMPLRKRFSNSSIKMVGAFGQSN
jgi:RimJ/RimL family protein N-acetyltransferase